MAYNKDNLFVHGRSALDGSYKEWVYRSADAIATVRVAGYISNGRKMGMKVGDIVKVVDTTNVLDHICYVAAINATTGAADLTDGLAVTATNTD
jgi:hypothetical protein